MLILLVAALVAGLVLLAFGSEQFVIGASRFARILRVSPVVIGAVVIGFGTSLPELLVTVLAASRGAADIAVGNAVGSNVANLTLVLGAAAVTAPLVVRSRTMVREAPLSAAAVVLLAALLVIQGGLGRLEGAVLVAALFVALGLLVAWRHSEDDPLAQEVDEAVGRGAWSLSRESVRLVVGLAGTLGGAQLLVIGAVGIADRAGLSEGFVGLTIVAVGTSLPELFTAIQAGRRGESDLVVGNVLGSNIFNSLGVAGLAALIDPGPLADNITGPGAMAMAVLAILTWLGMWTRRTLVRWEGVALLAAFAVLVPIML